MADPDQYTVGRPHIPPTIPTDPGFLSDLSGEWAGVGYNLIAVPNHVGTIFTLLQQATTETIVFSPVIDKIMNRGSQFDIDINGVHYMQTVTDVATGNEIHKEPGWWLHLPAEALDKEGYIRQAVIPHGDSVLASTNNETLSFFDGVGGPQLETVSSIPIDINDPIPPLTGPNLRDTSNAYFDPYTKPTPPDGITPEMVRDPVLLLKQHIKDQKIVRTKTIIISTSPAGGIVNIPFVVREANATTLHAIFWIETVEQEDGTTFQQLQYVQRVILDFPPDHWPHISVATLRKVA